MFCQQCGREYSDQETACPHCDAGRNIEAPSDSPSFAPHRDHPVETAPASSPTVARDAVARDAVAREMLPDDATRVLVRLEQCPHCRFMLFPADKTCNGCGKPVHAGAKPAPMPQVAQTPPPAWQKYAAPVAFGATVLGLLAVLFFLWRTL